MGSLVSTGGGGEKSDDDVQHVDTGDSLKVKQILDETCVKAVLEKGFAEDHTIDNIKITLMIIACLFAMTAQFYPMPFPQSRSVSKSPSLDFISLFGYVRSRSWDHSKARQKKFLDFLNIFIYFILIFWFSDFRIFFSSYFFSKERNLLLLP